MATESTISEALDLAIQKLDEAVKPVNMFERMLEQTDGFQLEGEALDGLRQILYRVVCASDAVCRLAHPEWLRYRDENDEIQVDGISIPRWAYKEQDEKPAAEAKDAVKATATPEYQYTPGRDC